MTPSPSSPFVFFPRNRLSKILTAPYGKTFEEHVRNAEAEVERIAPTLGEDLETDVQALVQLRQQDEAEIFGQCREIGWLALRIAENARLAKRPDLADVAEGIWEMIEALGRRGVWHTDALKLHMDALQAVISSTPSSAGYAGEIESELLRMRLRLGAAPSR